MYVAEGFFRPRPIREILNTKNFSKKLFMRLCEDFLLKYIPKNPAKMYTNKTNKNFHENKWKSP